MSVVTLEINIAYLAEIHTYQDRGRAFGDAAAISTTSPRRKNRDTRRYISSIPFVQRVASRNRWGKEREARGRVVEPGSRELTTNGRISRATLFSSLFLSRFFILLFFILFYKRGACKGSCLRTYFSRWFVGFVALSPRTTTVRSTFLLAAGLLALKSDATASLFRPAVGADLVGVGAAAVAAGSAGFALKSALIKDWHIFFLN